MLKGDDRREAITVVGKRRVESWTKAARRVPLLSDERNAPGLHPPAASQAFACHIPLPVTREQDAPAMAFCAPGVFEDDNTLLTSVATQVLNT